MQDGPLPNLQKSYGAIEMPTPYIYDPVTLLPVEWREKTVVEQIRIYNPAITRFRNHLLMAYRIDLGWGKEFQRRIGICELNEDLSVIPDSVNDLSASIQGGDLRHYDPRFLVYQDRLFVHYNNNTQTRPNQIFLVELDADTLEARAPARPLVLDGPRQEIEKNWMLFEHDDDLFAIYRIAPHMVLHLDLAGTQEIHCRPCFVHEWNVSAYADAFGIPCGGAPPVRQHDTFISIFHSRIQVGPLHRLLPFWPLHLVNRLPRYASAIARRLYPWLDQRVYYGGVYTFAATPPFAPRQIAPQPVLHPEQERKPSGRKRINRTAKAVVYPCGVVPVGDDNWLISYGLHDELCNLRRIQFAAS